ncbi:MAG: C45 family peptidase [Pseudomonadota bacterium]
MAVRALFRAVTEAEPGPVWAGLFREFWPDYRRWWAREGVTARPTYRESRRALGVHMPELLPLYDRLSTLAGGGDEAARFLSFFCPPPYLSACSQAIWPGEAPLLVRNYDYSPRAFDATVLHTAWGGRRVMGMSDGLWGLVDGVNDLGLAVSLTFGGRRVVGDGFGVPLILRYVLQTCATTEEAAAVLARVPCHMAYNVTVLDARRHYVTAYLAPDRPAVLAHAAVATNHQERVEWASHARFTATVERERFLLQRLTLHPDTPENFTRAFLRPPLYSLAFDRGFGTLYTAAYRPVEGAMSLHWPGGAWDFAIGAFQPGWRHVAYPEPASDPGGAAMG